jgi:serine/threonine protein phosphatase 1
VVVFLGDYVDRGPDSRRVVDRLIEGPPPGFQWVCLRGNHEDSMVRFLDDDAVAQSWLRNGGLETIQCYAGHAEAGDGLDALRDAFRRAVPRRHLEYLAALPVSHVEGRYLFVHAGLRPGVPLEAQSERDMMWIRDDFLLSDRPFGRIVVHGHSIRPDPEIRPNRIGIDTGAYATGRLTALVLEGRRRGFLST